MRAHYLAAGSWSRKYAWKDSSITFSLSSVHDGVRWVYVIVCISVFQQTWETGQQAEDWQIGNVTRSLCPHCLVLLARTNPSDHCPNWPRHAVPSLIERAVFVLASLCLPFFSHYSLWENSVVIVKRLVYHHSKWMCFFHIYKVTINILVIYFL